MAGEHRRIPYKLTVSHLCSAFPSHGTALMAAHLPLLMPAMVVLAANPDRISGPIIPASSLQLQQSSIPIDPLQQAHEGSSP